MHNRQNSPLPALLSVVFCFVYGCGESTETKPTKITLKLGGENCEFYLGAVEDALKNITGIQMVDLNSQKGQAFVTTNGTVEPKKIAEAVDALSGEGWDCEAKVSG